MGKKRMRYQWYQDVPRHVSRQDYQRLQLRNFSSLGLGFVAVAMALSSIFGLSLQTSQNLEQIDGMSIEKAIAHEGDPIDLIRLEGYLLADRPPTMPDNKSQTVIRGKVKLSARTVSNSGSEDAGPPQQQALFEWEENADPVFLSDGERRIPLNFDLAILPMESDSGDLSPRIIREGESARTSRPVAIEYGDQIYALPLDTGGQIDSVFTDFERQILPHGQAVVVVAGLEATPQGNQLIDPLGDRLQVLIGTEAGIQQKGQQLRVWFFILAIPLGIASFIVGRSANQLRREFIERSNQ
ncbi:hypothetical protein C1752_14062 [Acaryochloris thomasi RCC1774]|uniref:Uncharacterized protein n=1 Tax=Acaryochloris thomasi RCC1774 TaxID=1764569 RepID=A0A2W1JN36_9CYAN|nr:hypothetical protein [Acaryochloris thomasi]PZD70317.1 hypothetical protein C1752_14062 [Acaryochloris thomasi RCC1774]